MTCRDCKWWHPASNGKEGECRAHSPSGTSPRGKWPTTIYSDFCGDHSSVEEGRTHERNMILQSIADSLQKLLDVLSDQHEVSVVMAPTDFSTEEGTE